MGRGPIALLAAAAVVALIVAGCGGSDSGNASTISKAAFVKKADAICQKGTERMQRAFLSFLNEHKDLKRPSKSEYEKLVGSLLIPSVEREVKELRALGAPGEDEGTVNAIVNALEEGIETAENDPKAVTNNSDVIFGIASRLAGEYGLKACGTR